MAPFLKGCIVIVMTVFYKTISACSHVANNDISLNMYTNSGEISQVVYANAATRKGDRLIAFRHRFKTSDDHSDSNVFSKTACVILVTKDKQSVLTPKSSMLHPRKWRFDDCIQPIFQNYGAFSVAFVGYAPDIEYTRKYLNYFCQSHRFMYGESPRISHCADEMSRWLTRGLYDDYNKNDRNNADDDVLSRPLAVSMLMTDGKSFVRVDNSGCISTGQEFITMGNIHDDSTRKMQEILSNIDENRDRNGGSVLSLWGKVDGITDWIQRFRFGDIHPDDERPDCSVGVEFQCLIQSNVDGFEAMQMGPMNSEDLLQSLNTLALKFADE